MDRLDPKKTALVLIDLQKGILAMNTAPLTTDAVLAAGKRLAEAFRKAGGTVVLVHVGWSKDMGDAMKQQVDAPMQRPAGGLPADWLEFAEGLVMDGDLCILKRQWGAFHGTELDLQLRRRGVDTIVLGGIATNFGVESTGRAAWEHGYNVVFAEDAMASPAAEMHDFAVQKIFPRLGRIRSTREILEAIG
ncbi:Nicotinamidase-related amidase [Faunimonas pinastri]|uniref:Nicotinamidase-related amidase n=1 Tax=Faunimonas pinastri TaxID=1855383 RepID=A0A1H9IPY2_9HYPH|nr:hydrolase [Faunimonas pinastri]SEQ76569.1 Nicotinamidase-related amidase [Faunimonas pinastri]